MVASLFVSPVSFSWVHDIMCLRELTPMISSNPAGGQWVFLPRCWLRMQGTSLITLVVGTLVSELNIHVGAAGRCWGGWIVVLNGLGRVEWVGSVGSVLC